MTRYVAIPSFAALIPNPPGPVGEDTELGGRLAGPSREIVARTLSGKLVRPAGMSRWSRLDRYGRALVTACGRALEAAPLPAAVGTATQPPSPPPSGLYVASRHSCTETNAAYDHELITKGPERASPLLFPYTLPGSGAAEAAMHFGLGGAYLVMPGGAATALALFLAALDTLDDGGAERIVVASADVLGPATLRNHTERTAPIDRSSSVAQPALAEGAAALWLTQPRDLLPGPRVATGGALARRTDTSTAALQLIDTALQDAEIERAGVGAIISATASTVLLAAEQKAVQSAFGRTALQLVWRLGDAGASLGLMALCAGLEADPPDDEHTAVLILASDHAGSAAIVLQR